MIALLLNHLWQSTVFAGCAGLLALLFRNNGAHVRFALWFAASLKFMISFSLLAMLGTAMTPPASHVASPPLLAQIQPAAAPFTDVSSSIEIGLEGPLPFASLDDLLIGIWIAGAVGLLIFWSIRLTRLKAVARAAQPLSIAAGIPARSSSALMEPGLVGIWRPILLLPTGIETQLLPAEMNAIIAHEMSHARRRDNLTAAIHMIVQAIFWFYPLVWWIGHRLVAERERACDEAVVADGNDPGIYAESILKVCKYYLRSPLDCASGVSGADLKKRVEAIMENRFIRRLGGMKKAALAVSAIVAVGMPVAAGTLAPPPAQASATPSPGTQAALRHLIESFENHRPDLASLSSRYLLLPALVTPARLQRGIDSWGALRSIRFQGINPETNWDIYSVAFARQLTVWQIAPIAPDGKIASLFYTKAFARSDRTKPSPGTEAALRHQLEGWVRRDPPMDNVTPEIAAIDREQQPFLETTYFDQWGPLKSLRFAGVDVNGLDLYIAQFAHGRGVFPIGPLTPDHKIISWSINQAFDRTDTGPSPGTEASLRRYIEAMQGGAPNYDEMLPFVAQQVRLQLPSLLAQFKALGRLETVKFKSVNLNGLDVYDVAFEHGRSVWRIAPLTANGKVQMRAFLVVSSRGNLS